MACRAEGHPDNVAAALLGGLTVSCVSGERVLAVSLPVPADLVWVVLIPEMESSTRESRAILPQTVTRADAVFNLQRMGLLLAALGTGRLDALSVAMDDRLHEPQRQALFPWMEAFAAPPSRRERWAASCPAPARRSWLRCAAPRSRWPGPWKGR